MVFFRYSDVIAAGDILATDEYPVIDVAKGGTIQGELDGAEPHPGYGDSGIPFAGRHDGDSGSRAAVRHRRRGQLSEHGRRS